LEQVEAETQEDLHHLQLDIRLMEAQLAVDILPVQGLLVLHSLTLEELVLLKKADRRTVSLMDIHIRIQHFKDGGAVAAVVQGVLEVMEAEALVVQAEADLPILDQLILLEALGIIQQQVLPIQEAVVVDHMELLLQIKA
jgi:hypothetical protein